MILLLLLAASCAAAQTAPAGDDAREIILRSIAYDQRDLEIAGNYTYVTETERRRLDSSGRIQSTEKETHDVLVLYGTPYRRLIAKDGKPLAADKERKEQEKLDKEAARRKRQTEKDPDKLVRELNKQMEEQKKMIQEVADAFHLSILGEEKVDGYDSWVIQAEPRPDYRPRSRSARQLPHFRGKLWISKDQYRWVKIEAEVVKTLSVGLMLARLQPGTQLALEQQRVQDELWMPRLVRVHANGRAALVVKFNVEVISTYRDYRKFQSDSRISDAREVSTVP